MNGYPNAKDLKVENGTIKCCEFINNGVFKSETGEAISELPPFYRLSVNLKPTSSSNVNMELWLPLSENWNGRFLGTGNGGGAGSIFYDMIPVGLRRGFASANTDLARRQMQMIWSLTRNGRRISETVERMS